MSYQASVHHSFSLELAEKFGIEEAILIHHFQHWIQLNQRLKKNFIEGRTWTYQTYEYIAEYFPYLNREKVRRIIDSLVKKAVLIKGNFNKNPLDKTCWYAFANEKMFTKGEVATSTVEFDNPSLYTDTKDTDTKRQCNAQARDDQPLAAMPVKKQKIKKAISKTKEFELLESLGLGYEERALRFLSNEYSFEHIQECKAKYDEKAKKGKIKNPAAFFRSILQGKITGLNGDNAKKNREWVENQLKENNYTFIELKDKFVLNLNYNLDISLEMNCEEFKRSFKNLVEI